LVLHLAGNLLLYSGEDGRAFDEYANQIAGNPLLPVAEVALLLVFVVHIALAMRVSIENREARRERYAIRGTLGRRTLASSSMLLTGVLVLIFLVVHLYDFRWVKLISDDPDLSLWKLTKERLSQPIAAFIYLVGVGALGVHLRHAFRSAFQTLGVHHPRWNPAIVFLGWALAIVLALGFASFPVYFLLTRGPA
jgi:succinate dehydrogenase / fumarate reductase cytochrome b subunit